MRKFNLSRCRKHALITAFSLLAIFAKAQNPCAAGNLWVNGSFEDAAVGNHCNIFNPVNAHSSSAPFYGFTTFTWTAGSSLQPTFVNEATIDHTTGASGGHYLYADPRANNGVTSQIKQQIKVRAGVTYTFSAWVCSMLRSGYAGNPAVVRLYVNGTPVSAPVTLGSTSLNGWLQVSGTWTATATGYADVEITDNTPVIGGHDFAVDDVYFGNGDILVDAGPDAAICTHTDYVLGGAPTADFGATCGGEYTYSWSPSAGIVGAANVANPTINIATPGNYTYTVTVTDLNGNSCSDDVTVRVGSCINACVADNLWVNGSFEDAAVGNHCNIFNPVNGYSSSAPFYGFTTFTWTAGSSLQPTFVNEATIDHTTGAQGGHYLYADPRANNGVTSQIRQQIKVKAGVTYTFSAWVCSMLSTSYASSPAVVNLYVDGTPVSAPVTLNSTSLNGWLQVSGTWTAATTGYADVEITDDSPVIGGHDFAIDDVYFGQGDIEVDAGPDATICVNTDYVLGGAPTADFGATCGGEYTYNWVPATGIVGAANVANPTINIATPGVYTYAVIVTDLNGNTCSDKVNITVEPCKNKLRDANAPATIGVYPNPASGKINITGLPGVNVHITLFNMNGQKIFSAATAGNSYTTDIAGLPGGVYLFLVTDDAGNVLAKDRLIKE